MGQIRIESKNNGVRLSNNLFYLDIDVNKTPIKNKKLDFAVEELAPGKPDNAAAWVTKSGLPVFYYPPTKAWRYTNPNTGSVYETKRRGGKFYRISEGTKDETSVKDQIYTLSEKIVGESLVSNTSKREKLIKWFEDKLLKYKGTPKTKKGWVNSTYKSITAIDSYLSTALEGKAVSYEHVGKDKTVDEKFGTSDIKLTLDNGRTLGVSLKKEGDARLHNSSINSEQKTKDYFIEQRKYLLEAARKNGKKIPEGHEPGREESKKIKDLYGNKVLESTGKTLNQTLEESHKQFVNNALSSSTDIIKNNKLVEKIGTVFKNVQAGNLIIVSGDKIIDAESLGDLDTSKLTIAEDTGTEDDTKLITLIHDGVTIARIGIRQDGIGYGYSAKLEANFTKEFINTYRRKND